MTPKDFDLIIIESFVHETKQTFFEGKRETFKCISGEYINGLMNSFKRLTDEVNKTDYLNVILTTPEGEERQYHLRKESCSEVAFELSKKGKLSYPDKQILNIKEYTNGQFNFILSVNMMIGLWPELEKYCKSIIDEISTPEIEVMEKPQKFETLKPIEKILIVYYLNQQNKLFNNPINQLSLNSGKYFLSRLLDINPDSIRNPVLKISEYTTMNITHKEMTQQKALNLYPTLNTVKTFFDNSELFEISKVIETRINELKRKSGKD